MVFGEGRGKKILADRRDPGTRVSFYGRNFISNMEFRFLPKLIEFSKFFSPDCIKRNLWRVSHKYIYMCIMVVEITLRTFETRVLFRRVKGRASIYNDFKGSFF